MLCVITIVVTYAVCAVQKKKLDKTIQNMSDLRIKSNTCLKRGG